MVKAMGALGYRLLGLIVPGSQASACRCWFIECERDDGTPGQQECCKVPGHLRCTPCN